MNDTALDVRTEIESIETLLNRGMVCEARVCLEPLFREKKGGAETYIIRRKNEVQ